MACAPPPPGDPCLTGERDLCPCAPGFRVHPADEGCVPIVHDGDCPAGSRAVLGALDCAPVGVRACPAGFERDPSGFGCRALLPDAPCAAGIERLGHRDCVVIEDCDAAFPPAAATLFVDDDGERLDATHFARIGQALAAAPAGAVIAVEAGTYREWLDLRRPVHVVGRCPSRVLVQSASAGPPGAQAVGVEGVELQGLTLAGHEGGIVVVGGALVGRDLVLRDNRAGGVVAIAGARVELERVRVVGSRPRADGELGHGLFVSDGAHLQARECSLVDNSGNGVVVQDAGSVLTLVRSQVSDTAPDAAGRFGKGAAAGYGARLELVESALVRSRAAGLSIVDHGEAHVVGSVIDGVVRDPGGGFAMGIELDAGSRLQLQTTTVRSCDDWALFGTDTDTRVEIRESALVGGTGQAAGSGAGLHLRAGAGLVLEDSAVVDAGTVGVRLEGSGSTGTLRRSLVRGSRASPAGNAGLGQGLIVSFGARGEVEDCELRDQQTTSILVDAAGSLPVAPSALRLVRTWIRETRVAADGQFGFGVQVTGGAQVELERCALSAHRVAGAVVGGGGSHLRVQETTVLAIGPADDGPGHGVVVADQGSLVARGLDVLDCGGVGLAFGRAAATVDGGTIARNAIGLHVQSGTVLREVTTTDAAPVPGEVQVSARTRLVDNAARLGSGEIPLPVAVELVP